MKTSVWILGDQLIPDHPALEAAKEQSAMDDIVVLLIESAARVQRKHYAAKKLVLLFSAMRHYAEDLREAGFEVDYCIADDMSSALAQHVEAHHPDSMIVMKASSHRGQLYQEELEDHLGISIKRLANTMFLSNQFDPLPDMGDDETVRQETFYRAMRRHFDVLMDESGQPLGGQWNFDKKNRQKLPENVNIPEMTRFKPDQITQEAIQSVTERFSWVREPVGFDLAVTHAEAEAAAEDFFQHRLRDFGTYEDAMTQREEVLFHSKLSPYLNLGLLNPLDLAKRAQDTYERGQVEINNVEGFIRQVIGWREYMHWQYQRLMPDLADVNYFEAQHPLPSFYWTCETDMNCMKHVLKRSLRDGYAHHIERLMLLSNYCLLTGVAPQEVLDWFQSVFIDAYDWVMLPNVLGMGLYADGGRIGTKPYIASANYIHKMSDYCGDCHYDHKKRTGERACPFNFLYWHFLIEHEAKLRENPRMARMLYNLKYLDEDERKAVRKEAERLF